MHPIGRFLLVFILALMPLMASAAMWVNSLNYPVWIERGSSNRPLAPGDRLQDGDIVQTGAAGRVWLEVEDGSVIKLGRDTRFSVDRADFREVDNVTVLEAAFDVMKRRVSIYQRIFLGATTDYTPGRVPGRDDLCRYSRYGRLGSFGGA